MRLRELLSKKEPEYVLKNVADEYGRVKRELEIMWIAAGETSGILPYAGLLVFGSMGASVEDGNPPHRGADLDVQPLMYMNDSQAMELWADRLVARLEGALDSIIVVDCGVAGISMYGNSLVNEMDIVRFEARHQSVTLISGVESNCSAVVGRAASIHRIGVHNIFI